MCDNVAMRAQIEELMRQRRELRRLNDFLETEEARLEDELQAATAEALAAKEETQVYKSKEEALTSEVDTLRVRQSELEKDIGRVVTQLRVANGQVRDMGLVHRLATEEKEVEISRLKEKLEAATAEIGKLKKMPCQKAEVSKLKQIDVHDARSEVGRLTEEVNKWKGEEVVMKGRLVTAEERIATLEGLLKERELDLETMRITFEAELARARILQEDTAHYTTPDEDRALIKQLIDASLSRAVARIEGTAVDKASSSPFGSPFGKVVRPYSNYRDRDKKRTDGKSFSRTRSNHHGGEWAEFRRSRRDKRLNSGDEFGEPPSKRQKIATVVVIGPALIYAVFARSLSRPDVGRAGAKGYPGSLSDQRHSIGVSPSRKSSIHEPSGLPCIHDLLAFPPTPVPRPTVCPMSTDDIQSLRAEIEELKLQRRDLRQLKNFQEAETLRWKEEARIAKEEAKVARAESEQRSLKIAELSALLGHWEDEASKLQDELRLEKEECAKAKGEAVIALRRPEETEAAWKAEASTMRQELLDALKIQSASMSQKFKDDVKGYEAKISTATEELARSKAHAVELQLQLNKTSESNIRLSQSTAAAKKVMDERVGRMESQLTGLTGRLRAEEAKVAEYRLKVEQLEKELEGARRMKTEDDQGTAAESSRKRKRAAVSQSQGVKKEESTNLEP
ncbi:hypothetical protein NMY22_g9776 [Coprinellus aureogranulatus]|nr:hypothetical protein NMY22_g9776 [Coprinellus aureogranulatus]